MTIRPLTLTEFQTSVGVPLEVDERDALAELIDDLSISPTPGQADVYDLKPSSKIGAVTLPTLAVEIRPKIDVSRLLFLLSYAMDPARWWDRGFDFAEETSLFEALIPGFMRQVKRAFSRGLLQGYRQEEEALATVRGRIRFDDQIRYRQGIFPPIEVRYDEFAEDIEENRVVKAAILRLRRLRPRSVEMRRLLAVHDQLLADVSEVTYNARSLPDFSYTRLNERYRPAIQLSQLILRANSWDTRHGSTTASSFLVGDCPSFG